MAYAQAAKTGLEFLQARQKAAQQERDFQINRQRAVQARDLKIQSINSNVIANLESEAQASLDREIAALEVSERRAVVAAEAGFKGGSTVNNFINSPIIKKLRADTQANANVKQMLRNAELQKIGVSAETENRINSFQRGQEPNFLTYAAKAGAQLYAGYEANQALKPENVAARELAIQQAKEDYISGAVPLPQPSSWLPWQ